MDYNSTWGRRSRPTQQPILKGIWALFFFFPPALFSSALLLWIGIAVLWSKECRTGQHGTAGRLEQAPYEVHRIYQCFPEQCFPECSPCCQGLNLAWTLTWEILFKKECSRVRREQYSLKTKPPFLLIYSLHSGNWLKHWGKKVHRNMSVNMLPYIMSFEWTFLQASPKILNQHSRSSLLQKPD